MVLVTSLRRSLTTAFPDEETEVQRSPIAKSHKVSALVEAFHPEPLVLPRVCLWSASSQSDKKKKRTHLLRSQVSKVITRGSLWS